MSPVRFANGTGRSLNILAVGWFACVVFMMLRGRTDAVTIFTDVLVPPLVLLLAWLTERIAPKIPAPIPTAREPRRAIILQVALLSGWVCLTALENAASHGIGSFAIPGWDTLITAIHVIAQPTGLGFALANFAAYVLVPACVVLLLGARFPEIGFARFAPRAKRVATIWLFLPAAIWVTALATRRVSISFMLFQLLRNVLSNGFSEEFLWRGVLFTRLAALLGTERGMWTQAIAFGLWHFGYDYRTAPRHDVLLMLADMFASQVVLGYAFGWLTLRTRNIVIPAAFHAAFDSLGDAFGAVK